MSKVKPKEIKIVQIDVSGNPPNQEIYGLGNDGSLFLLSKQDECWKYYVKQCGTVEEWRNKYKQSNQNQQ